MKLQKEVEKVNSICVTSEIGPLKKVLVHRPGAELENLMPEYLERTFV